jgi:hypothetical protein
MTVAAMVGHVETCPLEDDGRLRQPPVQLAVTVWAGGRCRIPESLKAVKTDWEQFIFLVAILLAAESALFNPLLLSGQILKGNSRFRSPDSYVLCHYATHMLKMPAAFDKE